MASQGTRNRRVSHVSSLCQLGKRSGGWPLRHGGSHHVTSLAGNCRRHLRKVSDVAISSLLTTRVSPIRRIGSDEKRTASERGLGAVPLFDDRDLLSRPGL